MSLDTSPPPARARKARGAGRTDSAEPRSFAPDSADAAESLPDTGGRPMIRIAGLQVATDRVRAKPAVAPQVSFMLGQNAIGLGLWGLMAPKGVNRFLGLQSSPQATQLLFGAREMATGMALFSDPTRADALWARVAGDAFDIAVLSRQCRPENPKSGQAKLALGVVLAVTALDVFAAVRMSLVQRNCNSGSRA